MIFLALRHLISRKRQTLFTISGIFLGTVAFVVISSLMLGFREYLLDELINNDAHIHITAREEFLEENSLDPFFSKEEKEHLFWNPAPSGRISSESISNPGKWAQILKEDPRVAFFSPLSSMIGSFSYGKGQISANLVGCNPDQQRLMTRVGSHMIFGKFEDLSSTSHSLVIGHQIQKKLGVKIFQNVLVSLPGRPAIPFKVVGIFRTNNVFIDYCAYGSLGDVQKLKNASNEINEIAVKLYDHRLAGAIASSWAPLGVEKIESWDQVNASLFELFAIQDAVRFLSVGAVLVVAGFGIYNVLNMAVVQKRRDIAILRSMGHSPKEILFLFFFQGVLLGLVGAMLGLTLGYCLSLYLETIPFGGGPLQMGPGHLLVSFSSMIYVQAGMMGLFSSCIASLLPARAAGKLSPIEIIRSGAE
jgi:lipoprotein-releasing system permease protein